VNLRSSTRACAARVRLELIAISFVTVLIGVACLIVWSFEDEKFHTSGSALDIRLVAVRPDASDDLYDVAGRQTGTRPFDGAITNAWGSNMFRRDFIFELPEGVAIQPVYAYVAAHRYPVYSGPLPTNFLTSGRSYTLETSFADAYWHSSFFFGGQRPVEFVDVTLTFYPLERGAPGLRLYGPFAEGVTNKAQSASQSWWNTQVVLTGAEVKNGLTNALFLHMNTYGYQGPGSLSFLDHQGKRHLPFITNSMYVGGQWQSRGYVPGLNSNQIAAAEIHAPQNKVFHHVLVRYPERPVLTAPAPRGK
jgi:hypothetical protein